jgi:hypothetical protein
MVKPQARMRTDARGLSIRSSHEDLRAASRGRIVVVVAGILVEGEFVANGGCERRQVCTVLRNVKSGRMEQRHWPWKSAPVCETVWLSLANTTCGLESIASVLTDKRLIQ